MPLKFSKASQLGIDPSLASSINDSRKVSRRKALDKALTVWSRIVRARDKHCAWCGTTERGQAHHIVARSMCSTAGSLDTNNGMRLCFRCHIHRLKADPDAYIAMRDAYLKKRGLDYERLRATCGRRGSRKLGEWEIDLMRHELERQEKGKPE